MYSVLLPVDTAESRTSAQATTVVDLPNAAERVEATLLHVFDDADRAEDTSPVQTRAGKLAHDQLQTAGVSVDVMARHGDPSTEILTAAEEVDADMILMGGRKRSPLGSVLFGSVSQEVTLDATRPVVVTGDRRQRESPSHRCQSCGEKYHTDRDLDIPTCRDCGGTKVEPVGDSTAGEQTKPA